MRIFSLGLIYWVLVGCTTPSTDGLRVKEKALKPGQIPLEVFFRNPTARHLVLSPNGETLASLQPFKGRMNVFVKPINAMEWINLTKIDDRDISSLFWKGDDTLLFFKDFGGDENFHLFSVNVDGKNLRDLTPTPNTRVQLIDDLAGVSNTDVLIGTNQRDAKVFDVYRLNVKTGEMTLVFQNPGSYTQFLADHRGQLRLAVSTDGVDRLYFYRDDEKKPFRQVLKLGFKDQIQLFAFDKKNQNVFATSNVNRNTAAVVEWNPRTGKVLKTLYSQSAYDMLGLTYSREKQKIISAVYEDWKLQRHFFDEFYRRGYQDLVQKIPGKDLQIVSTNRKEDRWVVSAQSDRTGAEFFLYDVLERKLIRLLDSTPWLKSEDMVEMTPIEYTSRDGLKIMGYLFLPKNTEAKNLPVVINPHGGPWARDSWGFRPEAQFLANRGYAVLKMNFRGSTGFGKTFWQASFKQWGLKMQDDITDGVAWLVQKGIADKERIAIYGASYGGYATLAGLTFTPDLYRCGIDYVGVSNILTLLETVPPYWEPMRQMFYEMIGHPEKDKELLTKVSPVFHADQIVAPLFVVQGAQDPRVKKSESDQIVEALRRRGIDVPYLVKNNEGHGFRNEENRIEFYRQMEAFLDRHMQTR